VNFIPAKPTRFRGVTYRSRLEASWAVMLHGWEEKVNKDAPGSVAVMYEPFGYPANRRQWENLTCDPLPDFVGREPLDVTEYNPDFFIHYPTKAARPMMFEVKPVPPNDHYMKTLRGAGYFLAASGIELVLMVGGFREDDWPTALPYPFFRPEPAIKIMGGPKCFGLFNRARNFRWDLYQGD
jgi:hypothetical protein